MNGFPTTDERLAAAERLVEAYEERIRILRRGLHSHNMNRLLSADLRYSQAMDDLRARFYGELELQLGEPEFAQAA